MIKYNWNLKFPTFQKWFLQDLISLIIIIFLKLSPNEKNEISFSIYFKIFTHVRFLRKEKSSNFIENAFECFSFDSFQQYVLKEKNYCK